MPLPKKMKIEVPSSPWICQWVLSESVAAWSSDSTELCAGCSRQGEHRAHCEQTHHHPPSGQTGDPYCRSHLGTDPGLL